MCLLQKALILSWEPYPHDCKYDHFMDYSFRLSRRYFSFTHVRGRCMNLRYCCVSTLKSISSTPTHYALPPSGSHHLTCHLQFCYPASIASSMYQTDFIKMQFYLCHSFSFPPDPWLSRVSEMFMILRITRVLGRLIPRSSISSGVSLGHPNFYQVSTKRHLSS